MCMMKVAPGAHDPSFTHTRQVAKNPLAETGRLYKRRQVTDEHFFAVISVHT